MIEELTRVIVERRNSLTHGLIHGNAKSFEDYAKFVGQITTLEDVETTINDLLKKQNGAEIPANSQVV
jgi:tRNA isopentenyl-2-thiomethyl-A-37 hydroxylase MiaE